MVADSSNVAASPPLIASEELSAAAHCTRPSSLWMGVSASETCDPPILKAALRTEVAVSPGPAVHLRAARQGSATNSCLSERLCITLLSAARTGSALGCRGHRRRRRKLRRVRMSTMTIPTTHQHRVFLVVELGE